MSCIEGRVHSVGIGGELVLGTDETPALNSVFLHSVGLPRMGKEVVEPCALRARDYLRMLTCGEVITADVLGTVNDRKQVSAVLLSGQYRGYSVNEAVLREGLGRFRKTRGDDITGANAKMVEYWEKVASDAEKSGLGVYSDKTPTEDLVYQVRNESAVSALFDDKKDTELEGIVEKVIKPNLLHVRIPAKRGSNPEVYSVSVTAIDCGQQNSPEKEQLEARVTESTRAVENLVLHRTIRIRILGLFSSTLKCFVYYKKDATLNEYLLLNGLGVLNEIGLRDIKEHGDVSMMLASSEKGKSQGNGIWFGSAASTSSKANFIHTFEGRIVEVVSSDCVIVTVGVYEPVWSRPNEVKRIYLSGIRCPRRGLSTSPSHNFICGEGIKLMNKLTRGEIVRVNVEYERETPPQLTRQPDRPGGLRDSMSFAETVTSRGVNIAQRLIEAGLATVPYVSNENEPCRNRQDLLVAESMAKSSQLGLHAPESAQVAIGPEIRMADLTQKSGTRAKVVKGHEPYLINKGRLPAQLTAILANNRFKISIPTANIEAIVYASLIAVASPARDDKNGPAKEEDPCWRECYLYLRSTLGAGDIFFTTQRADRAGNLSGTFECNKRNLAVELIKLGYAWVIFRGAPQEYKTAEEVAMTKEVGIWASKETKKRILAERMERESGGTIHEPEQVADVSGGIFEMPKTGVVHVESIGEFYLDNVITPEAINVKKKLEALLAEYSNEGASKTPNLNPSALVLAEYEGGYHRARIVSKNPKNKTALVTYIDYGNSADVNWSKIRFLPNALGINTIPPLVTRCKLANVESLTSREYENAKLLFSLTRSKVAVTLLQSARIDISCPAIVKGEQKETVNELVLKEGYSYRSLPFHPDTPEEFSTSLEKCFHDTVKNHKNDYEHITWNANSDNIPLVDDE